MNLKIISSSSTNIRTRGMFRAVLSAVLFGALVFAVGCSDGDGDGDGNGGGVGDPAVIGSHGHLFVGDWTPDWVNGYQNERWFTSFKSDGNFYESSYQKVDNFWVGGEDNAYIQTWRADNKYLNIRIEWRGLVMERQSEYTLSGNTLTMFGCEYDEYDDDEYCWENVYTKGGNKPSGTIRTGDPALRRTYWRMESSSYFDFYVYEFDLSHGSIYFDNYGGNRAVWYTSGNRLYLIGANETGCRTIVDSDGYTYQGDCVYTASETVQFTYTHVKGVSLTLTNASRGINDVWVPYNYDNAPPLSKRGAETGKRSNVFRLPLPRLAPSGR